MDDKTFIPSSSSSRIMYVHYKDWTTSIIVRVSGTEKQLYTLYGNGCGRQLTVTDASDQQIGLTKIHAISSRIDVETRSESGTRNTFEMRNDKVVVGSPRYTSEAFAGQVMTWKNKALSSKIIYTLIDGQGTTFAHFESSPKSKVGTMEILNNVAMDDQVNEIVVTLLTLLYRKLQAIRTGTLVAIT
ncbi:MAG: hypothetical protein Q9227_001494 [Pyrenula ochraceoflavens]